MSSPEGDQLRAWGESGAAAVVAALLYLSGGLFLFFLVPLSIIALRRGNEGYLVAAAGALLIIAVVRGFMAVQVGIGLSGFFFFGELAMPAGLLAGLGLLRMLPSRVPHWAYRFALATGVATLGAVPVMAALGGSSGFEGAMEAQISQVMRNLGATDPQMAAEMIVDEAMEMVIRSFALFFGIVIGIGALLGRHLVARFSADEPYTPPVERVGVPDPAVWPLLGGWALVALDALRDLGFLGYLGWNLALVFTLIYSVQGVGIAAALMSRAGMNARSRRFAGIGLIAALFIPGINLLIALGIPALGVSELWVDFKREKET